MQRVSHFLFFGPIEIVYILATKKEKKPSCAKMPVAKLWFAIGHGESVGKDWQDAETLKTVPWPVKIKIYKYKKGSLEEIYVPLMPLLS